MWIADHWKDYEILDASGGERLERWGDYILVRPDPQVIWQTEKKDRRWKSANAVYHRKNTGGGSWEIRQLPETWDITYPAGRLGAVPDPAADGNDVYRFRLKPFSFKHTGLFPEQAANWDWFSGLIRTAKEKNGGRQVRVLNLFAYTGGATVAAAMAGAAVTHVDAARGMVTWAHENAALSGLANAPIRYLVDDCGKFVDREIRRGNRYDAVILDPPSYGRGPKGEIWKLEDELHGLLRRCASLLSDDPVFFLLNSYTTGLAQGVLSYLMADVLSGRKCRIESEEVGLPVKTSPVPLPCGASGRVVFF